MQSYCPIPVSARHYFATFKTPQTQCKVMIDDTFCELRSHDWSRKMSISLHTHTLLVLKIGLQKVMHFSS